MVVFFLLVYGTPIYVWGDLMSYFIIRTRLYIFSSVNIYSTFFITLLWNYFPYVPNSYTSIYYMYNIYANITVTQMLLSCTYSLVIFTVCWPGPHIHIISGSFHGSPGAVMCRCCNDLFFCLFVWTPLAFCWAKVMVFRCVSCIQTTLHLFMYVFNQNIC